MFHRASVFTKKFIYIQKQKWSKWPLGGSSVQSKHSFNFFVVINWITFATKYLNRLQNATAFKINVAIQQRLFVWQFFVSVTCAAKRYRAASTAKI